MPLMVTDPVGLSWRELLHEAAASLAAAGVPGAQRDARILLRHALRIEAEQVSLIVGDRPPEEQIDRFLGLVRRRAQREPVAHIIGVREFFGRRFAVTPDVLDPRPETEHLVESALDLPFRSVLDLGTGSGCIVISLLAERPMAHGVGVDISAPALKVARRNAKALSVSARARFLLSDWYEAVTGRFDLVVSNPPYIGADQLPTLEPEVREHEPDVALSPGADGLSAYRIILGQGRRFLHPGGTLIVECGAQQGAAVAAMFEEYGFSGITTGKDLAGIDRIVRGCNAA